ncbi:MAG: ABC transporter permease [Gemmobacter sp.]|nr:ABC transporter permease [Gemmobacter sp.]
MRSFLAQGIARLLVLGIAGSFLAILIVLVVVVPFLPGYDPYQQDIMVSLMPPLSEDMGRFHVLGTDFLGRDLLSRLALAGRISLIIALGAVTLSLSIGMVLGLIAGYFRGWTETVIMGIADVQLAIPKVLLLIAVTALFGANLWQLILIIGLSGWVIYGRVARSIALTLREREFVLAARTMGATTSWNIRRHLVPNVTSQMLIVGSYEMSQIILLEASLSYLGLGVQPPTPSWGMMIFEGQNDLVYAPWLSVFPGLALFMLVIVIQIFSQFFTSETQTPR